ncbi:hypothetical protein H4W33_003081 [Kibdelosporangium phytohabitans]|nr:hypothetical protein [Kibdelosporangium phytohabitans]
MRAVLTSRFGVTIRLENAVVGMLAMSTVLVAEKPNAYARNWLM